MKLYARTGALMLAGALSLTGLAACSSQSASDAPATEVGANLTDRQILENIILANPQDGMGDHDAVTTGSMTVSFGDLEGLEPMTMDYTMEVTPDPALFHMVMTTDSGDDEMAELLAGDLDVYVEENADGSYTAYSNAGGEWESEQISADEIMGTVNPSGADVDISKILDTIGDDAITVERKGDSYELTIDVPNDAILELMGEEFDDTMGDVEFTTYLIKATYDTETFYMTSMNIDLQYTVDMLGESLTMGMTMDGTVDNNPSGLTIVIPDEAKASA